MQGEPEVESAGETPAVNDRTAIVQKAAMVGVLASAATIGSSIIRSKVTAVVLGPEGVGRAAWVLQIVSLVLIPVAIITGPALAAGFARSKGDSPTAQRQFDTASTLLAAVAGIAILAVFGISHLVFPEEWAGLGTICALLACVSLTLEPLLMLPSRVLVGRGQTRDYSLIIAGNSLLLGLLVAAGTTFYKLPGQFAASALAPVVFFLIWRRRFKRLIPDLDLRPRVALDIAFLKEVAAVGSASVAAAFAGQAALAAIRWSLMKHGGDYANGQFQAAWGVGGAYFGVILQGLAIAVFPRFAAARTTEELQREVDAATRFVLSTAPPLILIAVAVREPMMKLLYSGRFAEGGHVLGIQMAADLAKAVGWVQAGPLLYRGKVAAFLTIEVLASLLFGGIGVALVPSLGIAGAAFGYAACYGVYLIVSQLAIRKACGVRVQLRSLLFPLAFGAVLLACVVYGGHVLVIQLALGIIGVVWGVRSETLRGTAQQLALKTWRVINGPSE